MKYRSDSLSLGLQLAKLSKVIGIKIGFIWPTIRVKLLLSAFGCTYGKNLRASGKVHLRLSKSNSITLGNNITLTARFLTNTIGITNSIVLETIKDGSIVIGDNSGLTSVIISARSFVKIGKYVKVGANVRIFDHDFHSLEATNRRNSYEDNFHTRSEEIVIEDDVFIGTNSIILKGVHIGAGSIIGAGSVVSLKQIPSNSVVVGNPAKIIKSRVNGSDED